MRAHQAASAASSSREKCTRPLVVGPSPVITPSRTTVSARAAVLRQEILDGSRAAVGSASLSAGADIGTLLILLFWAQQSMPRVNGWLTIGNSGRYFFKWLPIGRDGARNGSGRRGGTGGVGVIKGRIGAVRTFNARCGFFAAGA